MVDYFQLSRPADAVPAREAQTEYDFGCGQLLTLCGPRLRVLHLLGVHHWKALSYLALRSCTALKELELDAGADPEAGLGQRYLSRCWVNVLGVSEACGAQWERAVAWARGEYAGPW